MMDINPKLQKPVVFKRGWIYLMQKNRDSTLSALRGVKHRIIDKRFYNRRYKRGYKWYWGWVVLEEPIDEYDAMEAGLVPIFRRKDGFGNSKGDIENCAEG